MPASPAMASIVSTPSAEVALAGINTPLSFLSISAADTQQITVIISAEVGTLSAGVFPGAAMGGGGSHSLWIAGSKANVNAKLATLVYSAAFAGVDTLSFTLIDASGQGAGPTTLPIDVVPLITAPGVLDPTLTVAGGTLTLDTRQIDGITLNVHDGQTGAGAATLLLVNSTLGLSTALDIATTDPASPAPRLATAGLVHLDGVITFEAGPALVILAQNAVLTNADLIDFAAGSAPRFTGAGTLENDGTVIAASGSNAEIDVAVTGSGVISIQAGGTVTLGGAISAAETIRFAANSGTLVLNAPQSMHATIDGFEPGDRIQLGELPIDAAAYTQAANGGTLTLFDAGQVSAALTFTGTHQLGDFFASVATDSASDGGAITTLSVLVPSISALPDTATDADVYRFFDTASGAQLLTQDAAERDALIATRPDLALEGVAMGAVTSPSSDPAATAVYRLFDTLNGTHFLTSDASEKNALLATRPNLVFEPDSTIWEDATPQPGDVPVYRFFNTTNGTHFYTASATERSTVLTARPDLKAEGIAFYAPSS